MQQGVVQWSRPCNCPIGLSLLYKSPTTVRLQPPGVVVKLNSLAEKEEEEVTARDRRRLRNERRQSGEGINWRERVEERLIQKPKKRYTSWTEELNLDNLALLGPQWWGVRVSRASGQETADVLARLLARSYPDIEFKLYNPSVEEKRKLKNGSYSVKARPIFPGCVFLHCVLNKELHDFIREINGVGGFIGSKVGNTKRQINKPRPVSDDDMEAMFTEAKEEQLKADQAFLEMEAASDQSKNEVFAVVEPTKEPKPSSKSSVPSISKKGKRKLPTPGSTVKVVSGAFADFPGVLRKLDRKNGKASVGFTLLGKETIVEVDIEQIEVENE
ncbi:hypothetical protein V2J09_016574 [Rumex salicifolius]